jgi:nucleoside-diphosphate-sugar epimerase
MKRAIVSGATGFIGSYLVKELLDNNYDVLAIVREDSKNAGRLDANPKLKVIKCNLNELSNLNLQEEMPYDYFFHMAWDGVSGEVQTDYNLQMSNINAALSAMDVAKSMCCKRFIGAGSIHEIECNKELSGDKEVVFQGHSYKIAKLAAHYYCKLYASKIGMDFLWPLLTNTFGAGEVSPRLINTIIRRILEGTEPALTQCDQLYDFIYITDAARAYRLIAEQGISYKNYIIGSGKVVPLKEYITELRDTVNPDIPLGFGKHPYNGIYLNKEELYNDQLLNDTGFQIEVSFEQGIRKTMDSIINAKN